MQINLQEQESIPSHSTSMQGGERYHRLARSFKGERLISRGILLDSLKASAAWLNSASDSAEGKGIGHRMAMYYENGYVEWLYPFSNTGELISAWMDLSELLNEPLYLERARRYALSMLEDPVCGFYGGAEQAAHGLVRYWTNGGSYSGLYSMRMPLHYHRLYEATGDERFLEICHTIGKTLLSRQLASGLVGADWSAERGWDEGEGAAGARILYGLAAFATLYRITGDRAYLKAYHRSVDALQKMQNADGSFFQVYLAETAEPHPEKRSVKPFLYSYILNAIAEAYSVMEDERVLEAAQRLGSCLAGIYYYRNAIPYCTGEMSPSDLTEANGWSADAANGLLWLAGQTGVPTYRDIGTRLWLDAWNAQIDAPDASDAPGWHGALIQGINPDITETLQGVHQNRNHLFYQEGKIGKCTLWYVVNHVFATKRLLS